ncbi:dermonecrotic toxin domain-containing protein [Pseudomonas sp. NPDC078416]|uniref:dermonecrotic toxin domain-containing protein n=1 Tax=Pseudomonas sp. NPDC078416 TaxID=3390637 RepID=UPI003CFFA1C5
MSLNIDLIEVFSRRPTLADVTLAQLRAALQQHFPDLHIDPQTAVITRTTPDESQRAETLLRNVQQAFLTGKTPRWTPAAHTLVLHPEIPDAPTTPVDFDTLNILADTVALGLAEAFQQALVAFWGAPVAGGQSPWARLSDALSQHFSNAVANSQTLKEDERKFLRAIAGFADKTQRDFMLQIDQTWPDDVILACILHHRADESLQEVALPVLVATGIWRGSPVFFSWQAPGVITRHASQADLLSSFNAGESAVDPASWTLRESGEDIFDALSAAVLERQLWDLAGMDHATAQDFAGLEHRVIAITDISTVLLPFVPGSHTTEKLPQWLRNASVNDRLDFSRRMIALAGAQARSGGKTFNEGLPPLLDYAAQQLQRALLADHPEATDMSVADLEVVISQVVAVAIPHGGEVITSGSVEPMRMSVAEFALENLSGQPAGTLHVLHRDGRPMPEWFTADYLRLLVCKVDIGRNYPALVERVLVSDSRESVRRQALYIDQLRVQLPLQALEQKIRGAAHFCTTAYGLVAALMLPREQRPMALRDTTLRPLGFRAGSGASADLVTNMFVISDQDPTNGPVVLYRPLSRQSLTEFSSMAALHAAIVEPGQLSDEVLTWMTDRARQVYANGGFDQPHIVRFGQGSEFAPLETPAPAQLTGDEVTGDPLVALYQANASALIELADRQSTSNAESRWTLLKRGGWLALDMVMPFVSGTAGTALWLVQLMVEAQAQVSADSDAHEGAASTSNLLLTVAMLLLHNVIGSRVPPRPRKAPQIDRPNLAELLAAHPTTAPEIANRVSTPPDRLATQLEFSWSRPDLKLSMSQRTALRTFELFPKPRLPEPSSAPGALGLYEGDGVWYAQVDDAVYRVRVNEDEVLIVDPQHVDRAGPRLVRDGTRWRLDLALRLKGGGPKRSVRQMALENAARLKRVNAQKAELIQRQTELYSRIVENDNRFDSLPIHQHQDVIASLETDIREVIDIIDRKNELDQQLRPADRTSDKVYAKDLQGVARRICLLEGLLLSDMLTLAREDLVQMRALSNLITAENVGLYLALFEKSLVLQEIGVKWSLVREGLWQRLRAVPKVGEGYWRTEALEFYNNRMFAVIDWRASRMWSSLELCFKPETVIDGHKAVTFKRLLNDDDLHGALTSQAELEKPHDYSIAEQICVLESSLRQYDRASMAALAAFESEPEAMNTEYFQRFFDDLSAISDRAEHRLSDLIRESEEPADTPVEYVPRVKQARKRVIKTRGQRTLIGRLREGEEPALGEVVEVKAATGDRVIGAYHQHAEGEWVELEAQRPKPVSRDSIEPMAELIRRSQALLERVEPDIANAVRQSRRANEPEDMEDILGQKADKLRDIAQKLQVYGDDSHAGQGDAQALEAVLAELRTGEARLREQGRQLRIEMIKRQPPTASRISYLDRQREVNIARYDGRKNMSGARRNDFVQEYAIRDKEGQLLWWAHFHYASEDAAADAFTAAHLKLPEQRLLGYRAMLKAAKDNKEVVSIYRSVIGKDLAQRLFLHLAE